MAPTHSHHTLSLHVHAQHPWVGLENVLHFPGVCVLSFCLQRSSVSFPLWKPPASSPRVHSQLMALCLLTEKAGHPKGPSRPRAHPVRKPLTLCSCPFSSCPGSWDQRPPREPAPSASPSHLKTHLQQSSPFSPGTFPPESKQALFLPY